jgi:hypothetical protein
LVRRKPAVFQVTCRRFRTAARHILHCRRRSQGRQPFGRLHPHRGFHGFPKNLCFGNAGISHVQGLLIKGIVNGDGGGASSSSLMPDNVAVSNQLCNIMRTVFLANKHESGRLEAIVSFKGTSQ